MDLLESYQDPTNLTKGILNRLQFKNHEKRALEPVYDLHAQFQTSLQNPNPNKEELEDIAEELILTLRLSEIQRQKWKWVECMEQEEQALEYNQMKETDEAQRVTQEEIERLLERRQALEKMLANKIEFDKQMDSVRTQPSRKESTQRIADLELEIEALQRRIKEQKSKIEDQKLTLRNLFLPLTRFRDVIKENMLIRDDLRKEYTEASKSVSSGGSFSSATTSTTMTTASTTSTTSTTTINSSAGGGSSSSSRISTGGGGGGEEEGEIDKKEINIPAPLHRQPSGGGIGPKASFS